MTEDLDAFARALMDALDGADDVGEVFQRLDNAGVLNRVKVGTYLCELRGCKLAVVIDVGGRILARTRDHKKSAGLNEATTAEAARRSRTLDGEKHWPGHAYDVTDLAEWDGGALVPMPCRHRQRDIDPREVLAYVEGARPGHPIKPRRV